MTRDRPLTTTERNVLAEIARGHYATVRKTTDVQRDAIASLRARHLIEVTPRGYFLVITDAGRRELDQVPA